MPKYKRQKNKKELREILNKVEDEKPIELFNYNPYIIKKEKTMYCLKCGQPAKYIRYGYTWCEEHKNFLEEDPEDLEYIIIERLEELEQ